MSAVYEITADNLKSVTKNSWKPVRRFTDEKIQEILTNLNTSQPHEITTLEATITNSKYNEWMRKQTKLDLVVLDRINNLDKILDREVVTRKKVLISRVEKKVGKIQDASGLYLGVDGEINGYIKGEKAAVEVRTIYAGGHNIQCLHYRVLVK